jgi:peptidoglycan-N-acetylmuramic acid deacetylase
MIAGYPLMRLFPFFHKFTHLSKQVSHYIQHKRRLKKAIAAAQLFIFSFLFGTLAAYAVTSWSGKNASYGTDPVKTEGKTESKKNTGSQNASSNQGILSASNEGNWGLSFQQEGKPPVANASMDYLAQFNAHYALDTEDKVLYLTFDAGYENGNTASILDALKKHNAPATFFLVGNYLETSPDLVKRMVEEGHTVGNHTYHHPDMSKLSTKEAFQKELSDLEALYQQTTGQTMKKYYRPPQGKYSEANLTMAKEMGYHTFFWSLAYVDWYEDKQPTKEEAFQKLLGRIHPGAIVLLHSTSKTNGQILDELLTKWEEMGYRFAALDELAAGSP